MSPSDHCGESAPDPLTLPGEVPERLLEWYDKNRRDLPWRRTTDPYRIWVSEIMLQQTTVSTVLRYYERFLEQFSTVSDLARAPLPEVLKLWEGLGYYQRARNLHRASRMIPQTSTGPQWPRTVAGWMLLPGIGRSTAGAILSISSGVWAPILDANVRRVMERFFGVPETLPGRESRLWSASNLWGKGNPRPSDTNQALMELGALLCLPSAPDCRHCPVETFCIAGTVGSVDSPGKGEGEKTRKKKTGGKKPVRERVALIPDCGLLLFEPRNEGRLLEGLLDLSGFSSCPLVPGAMIPEGPFSGFRVVRTLFSVRQTYSHFQEVVYATMVSRPVPDPDWAERFGPGRGGQPEAVWASVQEAQNLGLTGVARKIVNRLSAASLP